MSDDARWLDRCAEAIDALAGVACDRGAASLTARRADGRPLPVEVRVTSAGVVIGELFVPVAREGGDGDEIFASTMDLVVAALRGDVVVVERRAVRDGLRLAARLVLGPGETTIASARPSRWRDRIRRGETVRRANALPGLPAATDVVRPPWAPWAGSGGFTRAGAAAPSPVPIDGVLDLHSHDPRDVGRLVAAYLDACRERGVLQVRIIHGKGKGVLRRTVHASLERRSDVAGFELGGHGGGSWGATVVDLVPPGDST